jgi:hypothetical protein
MNELEIDVNPLVHDYFHGRPIECVDLCDYLRDFLYEPCIQAEYARTFVSTKGTDGVPIFRLKDSGSLAEACSAAVEGYLLSSVLFFDVSALRKPSPPPDTMRLRKFSDTYSLFLAVRVSEPGQYDLYFRDAAGWLRIGKTIKPVAEYEMGSACMVGYIRELKDVAVHREPVKELTATVARFLSGEMKFEPKSGTFHTRQKVIKFFNAHSPDPLKFACYWIDGGRATSIPEFITGEAVLFLEAGAGTRSILRPLFERGQGPPESEMRARELKVTIKFPSGKMDVSFEKSQTIEDLINFCEEVRQHLGVGQGSLPEARHEDGTQPAKSTRLSLFGTKPVVVTFATRQVAPVSRTSPVSQTVLLIIQTGPRLTVDQERLPPIARGSGILAAARPRFAGEDLDLFHIGTDKMSMTKIDPTEQLGATFHHGKLMVQKHCRNPVPFAILKMAGRRVELTGTMFMLDLKWPVVLSGPNEELKDTLRQLSLPVAEIFARRLDRRLVTEGECHRSDTGCICVVLQQNK